MRRRPVVLVRWSDACSLDAGEWNPPARGDTGVLIDTVGFLVRKTRTHLVVAQSSDSNPEPLLLNQFSIPRVNVVRFRVLKGK